jgi:hypothetical protein
MEEKDKKKAINCRFSLDESDEFFEWLNNQSNMTIAIRNLIYHAIDLYGTSDFIAPDTQKEVMRNTFMFEATKNQKINPFTQENNEQTSNLESIPVHENTEQKVQPIADTKIEIVKPKEEPKKAFYQNVDQNNL